MEESIVKSPRWSSTTKLLVGLVIIGFIAIPDLSLWHT